MSIIGAGIVPGGKDAIKVYRKGQFCVSIEHVNGEESLCIWPLRRQEGAGAMVVGLSALHQYFEQPYERGRPSRYGMVSCMQALDVMKIGATDKGALIQLLDILYEYAPDVKDAPPDLRPAKTPKGIDGAELLVDGEVVSRVGSVH